MTKKLNNFFLILLLGALTTITPFSIDMYLPAFPQIAKDFATTPSRVSLSLASYFIGFALGQLIYGPLLDRFGRKIPLYVGLGIYILACIGCVNSNELNTLVAFRFIQALGGCAAAVAAMAMVRDFFPRDETAKIISLLMLVLGVSPLLAPTIGGFVVVWLGWHAVFILLAVIVAVMVAVVHFTLPESHVPDKTISLKPGTIAATYFSILKYPKFYTYALSGAVSFASLFAYVSGSPIIFMQYFQVSPQVYGAIFAGLSVGFIGGNQVNILLMRKFNSEQIFRVALFCQVIVGSIFLIGAINNWYGLYATIILFFLNLSCLGLVSPNASALALTSFTKNIGSAAALLGFLQIGAGAVAACVIGFIASGNGIPIIALFAINPLVASLILYFGKKKIATEGDLSIE